MPGPVPPEVPAEWPQFTPQRKKEWRFDLWRRSAERVDFVSPEAEARYRVAVERLIAEGKTTRAEVARLAAERTKLLLILLAEPQSQPAPPPAEEPAIESRGRRRGS